MNINAVKSNPPVLLNGVTEIIVGQQKKLIEVVLPIFIVLVSLYCLYQSYREHRIKKLAINKESENQLQMTQASQLKKQKNYEGAKKIYSEIIQSDPTNSKALTGLAQVFVLIKLTAERETFENQVKNKPEDVRVKINYANYLSMLGDQIEADKQYKQILDQDKENIDALMGYANSLRKQAKFDEAEKLYHQIIALKGNPHLDTAVKHYINILLSTNQIAVALDFLNGVETKK